MDILEIIGVSIVAGHWLIMVALATRVILRKGDTGASLAWLTIIFFLPYGGAALYILIGENRLGEVRGKRATRIREQQIAWQESLNERTAAPEDAISDALLPLERQALAKGGFAAQRGNQVELLDGAGAFFPRLIEDIDSARESIALEFYIWDPKGMAAQVTEALGRAVERGVTCRVLLDSVGSRDFLRGQGARRLRAMGVDVVESLPANLIRVAFQRLDLRNHRKIVAIDGQVGYIGSQNLVDPEHFRIGAGVGPWVDLMVRVTGPAVAALSGVIAEDWELERGGAGQIAFGPDEIREVGDTIVQIVPSGPSFRPQAIRRLLLSVIYSARSSVVLSTPYFVPEESMVSALISAHQRGVDVTLIVPRKVDSKLVRYASRSHYEELLEEGVRIMQFDGGLLHSKAVAIDNELSVIGSVNLDMRSMRLNFEVSALVYDRRFAEELRALLGAYIRRSEQLSLDAWRRRAVSDRFLEGCCRLLGPML